MRKRTPLSPPADPDAPTSLWRALETVKLGGIVRRQGAVFELTETQASAAAERQLIEPAAAPASTADA